MAMGSEMTFAVHRVKVLMNKVKDARLQGSVNPELLEARNDAVAEYIALLLKSEEICGVSYPQELKATRQAFQQKLEQWQRQR
jgi:hypothetical protein